MIVSGMWESQITTSLPLSGTESRSSTHLSGNPVNQDFAVISEVGRISNAPKCRVIVVKYWAKFAALLLTAALASAQSTRPARAARRKLSDAAIGSIHPPT